MNTAEEILSQLDHSAGQFSFPALDNGYIYPADVRLSIYRNPAHWLMVIEHLGVNPRTGGFGSIQNCLHLYGSNLHRAPGLANEDFLCPVEPTPGDCFFEDKFGWYVRDGARSVTIRGKRIELDLSPANLKQKEIDVGERADAVTVLRSLVPEHRAILLASAEELAARNPHMLPLWMRLDEWHHPDVIGGELPGKCETFQMLAAAIASGDKTLYQPTKSPNTHWTNWPEGGSL